jgi:hypothetical protein
MHSIHTFTQFNTNAFVYILLKLPFASFLSIHSLSLGFFFFFLFLFWFDLLTLDRIYLIALSIAEVVMHSNSLLWNTSLKRSFLHVRSKWHLLPVHIVFIKSQKLCPLIFFYIGWISPLIVLLFVKATQYRPSKVHTLQQCLGSIFQFSLYSSENFIEKA